VTDEGGPKPAERDAAEAAFEQAKADVAPALPSVDFSGFVLSLSHSALIHLGDAPNPADGKLSTDLEMARHTIDLLGMLAEKTQNNLTGGEETILGQSLYDLRMRYVEVAKATAGRAKKSE
jgi:hypothetical protein